jgi:small subunit ribosomal protein S15
MGIYLSKETVKEIFKEYGGSESNTGSVEGQIALFTYRIKKLSEHLNTNHKDHSCRKTLLELVGKRRGLLTYLAKQDINKYRELIEKLGIRK